MTFFGGRSFLSRAVATFLLLGIAVFATAGTGFCQTETEASVTTVDGLMNQGDAAMQARQFEAARHAYEKAVTVAESLLAESVEPDAVLQRYAYSLWKLGELEVLVGDIGSARKVFALSMEVSARRVTLDPADAQAILVEDLNRLGDLELGAGDVAAAQEAYRKSVSVAESLRLLLPNNGLVTHLHALTLGKLGDAEAQLDNLSAARDAYTRSLVVNVEPSGDKSPSMLDDDIIILWSLGAVEVRAGNLGAAHRAFQSALVIAEGRYPGTEPLPQFAVLDLVTALVRVGEAQSLSGKYDAALASMERAVESTGALDATDPDSADVLLDLGNNLCVLGEEAVRLNRKGTAYTAFGHCKTVTEQVLAAGWEHSHPHFLLAAALVHLGRLEEYLDNQPIAFEHYERSLDVLSNVARVDPSDSSLSVLANFATRRLLFLRRHLKRFEKQRK